MNTDANIRRMVCFALSVLLLLPPVPLTIEAAEQAAARAEDFLIVDCLLPGQVRKLGSLTTYVTQRRAVRTSATDCGIRGGEYVAYDRADYRTALTVWLPQAREGDPEAMNNVGQIYEKGLGTLPDPAAAAHWYRQAADKGYTRAQINLGFLYETGMGVERNPREALSWYRKASGLDAEIDIGGAVTLNVPAPATPAADPEQVKQLEQQLAALRNETSGLRDELAHARTVLEEQAAKPPAPAAPDPATESELAAMKRALRQREQETADLDDVLARTRQQLQQTQTSLAEAHQQTSAQTERLQMTQAELKASRDAMQEKVAELSRLETELQAQRAELTAGPAEPVVVVTEDPRTREELEAAKRSLQERDTAVAELDRRLATTREQLQEARSQAQTEVSQSRSELERRADELRTLESELVARREELASTAAQNKALQARVTELEAGAREKQVVDAQQLAMAERLVAGPEITLIDPVVPVTRGTEPLVLRSAVATRRVVGRLSAPAGLLSLSVNDQPTDPNNLGVFVRELSLQPGKTRVSIVAVDNQGKRGSLDFDFLMAAASAAAAPEAAAKTSSEIPKIDFGKFHALIIGNNEYQSLGDLRSAVNDARDLAKLLGDRYGAKSKVLLNATRYDILSALNEYRSSLTKDDNLLIYYAGHGILDDINNRGHWLPVDATADNTANWISTVDITDILNVMQAARILVISDSCYSGALTRSATPRLAVGKTERERVNWLRTMATKRARMVLTSGGLQPVLDTGGGDHSVFGKALLDVLAANGDILDGSSLHREVAARVAYSAAQVGFDQVPEYAPIHHAGHEAGEFFLVPRAG